MITGFYTQRMRIGPLFYQFWQQNPALLYGLFLYLGALSALSWHPCLLIPVAFLFLSAFISGSHTLWQRMGLGLLLSLAYGMYVSSTVLILPSWAQGQNGFAEIQIREIVPEIRYGKSYYILKVDLLRFEAKDQTFYAQQFPCKLIWNTAKPRPKADAIYQVPAYLTNYNDTWTIHADKEASWTILRSCFSLVEWRYAAKCYFKRLLATHMPAGHVRAFLEGVVIGEFHDAHLAANLQRFGLQHIIVVSGFHFSLIAAIFAALVGCFCSRKVTSFLLLFLTLFYLLFVGPSPSVVRAYIAIGLVLLAKIIEEKSSGINSLGMGLIIALFIEPLWATSLSFTLSFLATWAILLFYPITKRLLATMFPKRRASDLLKMSFSDQVAFVFLTFFLSSFALVASVSLFVLPMSLYSFLEFPLLGIIYNCFFPFLISICIFFLCLGLSTLWLPPLAWIFFSICYALTDQALTFVTNAPSWFDIVLRCSWMSLEGLVFYLCFVSFLGIVFYRTEH